MSDEPEDEPTLAILAAGRSRRQAQALEPLGPHGETQYAVHDAALAGMRASSRRRARPAELGITSHRACRRRRAAPRRTAAARRDAARDRGGRARRPAAAREIRGPFVVANADDLYGAQALEVAVGPEEASRDRPRAHAIVGSACARPSPAAVSRPCAGRRRRLLAGAEEVLDVTAHGGAIAGRSARTGARRAGRQRAGLGEPVGVLSRGAESLRTAFDRFRGEHAGSADAEFLLGEAVQALVAASTCACGCCRAPRPGTDHPSRGPRAARARSRAWRRKGVTLRAAGR